MAFLKPTGMESPLAYILPSKFTEVQKFMSLTNHFYAPSIVVINEARFAGFPEHVPGVTVERKCGSSQQAVDFAVQGVVAGAYDVVIAAGLESMSRIPMGVNRLDQDPHGPLVHERYPDLTSQGVAAELARWFHQY